MYWTLELAHHLEEAPWPATRDELIDYSIRSGAPIEVIENLQEMEDEGELFESIEDISLITQERMTFFSMKMNTRKTTAFEDSRLFLFKIFLSITLQY